MHKTSIHNVTDMLWYALSTYSKEGKIHQNQSYDVTDFDGKEYSVEIKVRETGEKFKISIERVAHNS